MLLLVGAIPIRDLPLLVGRITLAEQGVIVDGQVMDVDRGTPAMMTVACIICEEFGLDNPTALVAGDIGTKDGSMKIYEYLIENVSQMDVNIISLHYIMPDIKSNQKLVEKIRLLNKRPVLLADAGSMYVAKAGGNATDFDVFTPDLGETAFLADEQADHPTYTRGFIFRLEDDVPELIRRAYEAGNAAHTMFVKGEVDYICQNGRILEEVSTPNIEALEPVGGTGDTITGIISALIYAGKTPLEACRIAARVNRRAGELSNATPATQVKDIIKHIPAALREVLSNEEFK
jgi:NAD(P)H-hydrate repair Nnr-like enzyme with NAD(P)H-hydrate dehydratase domain